MDTETSTANEGWPGPGSQATFAFPAEIPSLKVGPLGQSRPWLYREFRSCVVELVARKPTGWVWFVYPSSFEGLLG
ncbi:hypothetical protein AB3S75_033386 [Citrus x aurantiifolia]